MRVIVTGGGTGGHIYPALSIARKIKDTFTDAEILYVGTEKGLEATLVPKEGFNFKAIRVKGFSRKLSKDTLNSAKELCLGMNDARKVIKDFKPDIVIGTGGYVCGPVVMIAAINRIPTMIHEQNAFHGVTNKILSKFVNKVAGSFEESKARFNNSKKVVITGNPVRQELFNVDKESAREELHIKKDIPLILCFGGSGGQKSLNDAMLKFIKENNDNENIQILHMTGERFYEKFILDLKEMGNGKLGENIRVVPYFYEMAKVLNLTDLAITSGGAITIAELTSLGIPSIIVPKAYTAENHQEYNAHALENKGAGIMIKESELSYELLSKNIHDLLDNPDKLKKMSKQSMDIGIRNADEKIVELVKEIIKDKLGETSKQLTS